MDARQRVAGIREQAVERIRQVAVVETNRGRRLEDTGEARVVLGRKPTRDGFRAQAIHGDRNERALVEAQQRHGITGDDRPCGGEQAAVPVFRAQISCEIRGELQQRLQHMVFSNGYHCRAGALRGALSRPPACSLQ